MDIYIMSAVRTPIGSFGGSLKDISAVELGSIVIKESLQRADIPPESVHEVIMGNVIQSGLGLNPARQAALKAGIPINIPSMTINKVCGSGLKSISLAAQAIHSGDSDIIVAGGMENMSQAPFLLKKTRWGQKLGHAELLDSILQDGLTDPTYSCHMGITAENLAEKYQISREEQDRFAFDSQQKTKSALESGKFMDETISISIHQKKEKPKLFVMDEYPRQDTTLEKLSELKPAFKEKGMVTAGNSSGINDGAAALVIISEKALNQHKHLKPLAKIKGYHAVGVDPQWMGIGPVEATRGVLKKTGVRLEDIDLIEINEAFAAQTIAVGKELNWDNNKVNVNGGAIALGHPIGASGTRILVTLLHEMIKRNLKLGLATLCIGGGQGIGMLIER